MKDGCPCGTQGKCCDNTESFNPDHECSDESVCEECYVAEWSNCGSSCCCDL